MPNACFQCKEPISSGQTFCGACRQEVSLEFQEGESDRWGRYLLYLAVVQLGVLGVAGLVFLVGRLSILPGIVVIIGTLLTLLTAWLVPYALYKDLVSIRRLDDVDWSPSTLTVGFHVLLCLAVVLQPVVALVHLWRRRRILG